MSVDSFPSMTLSVPVNFIRIDFTVHKNALCYLKPGRRIKLKRFTNKKIRKHLEMNKLYYIKKVEDKNIKLKGFGCIFPITEFELFFNKYDLIENR